MISVAEQSREAREIANASTCDNAGLTALLSSDAARVSERRFKEEEMGVRRRE